jgi:hypothetical protein
VWLVYDVRMWCTAGAETTCAPWWVVEGQAEDAAPTRIALPSLLRWLLQTQSDASGGPGAGRGVDMGSLPAWAQQVYRGTARAGRKAVRARAHRASSAAHGKRRRRALDRRRSRWESRWRESLCSAAGVGDQMSTPGDRWPPRREALRRREISHPPDAYGVTKFGV